MASQSNIFRFKEFVVDQTHAAMKVGTDAVILGSWTDVVDAESILDIGTGTGILALMLAQRSNASTIDAVEIDEVAFEEAVSNFENSLWGDRLFCYHASIQEFAEEMDEKYDLIICNPPYFEPNEISTVENRKIARETYLLNHTTLVKCVSKLLSENGICTFSLPTEIEETFVALCQKSGLIFQRVLRVKDLETTVFVRSFLQFGFQKKSLEEGVIVLKNEDKTYTNAFKKMTKEFYLKH